MLFKSVALLYVGAQITLTSASGLCIQGCCGLTLKLAPHRLSLTDSGGVSQQLPGEEIPCCPCPGDAYEEQPPIVPVVQNEGHSPIQARGGDTCPNRPPPNCDPNVAYELGYGWCTCEAPCCRWAKPLRCKNPQDKTCAKGCCPRIRKAPHPIALEMLSALSISIMRPEAKVCDVGACKPGCLCRETALYQIQQAVIG